MIRRNDGIFGASIVQNAKASSSFDAKGNEISEGSKTTRVQLDRSPDAEGVNKNRTLVATAGIANRIFGGALKTISGYNPFSATIRLRTGDKIALNINSLSKRLHISKSDIKEAIQNGTFVSLLRNHGEKHIGTALRDYETYLNIWNGELPSGEQSDGLTPEKLMHVLKVVAETQLPAGVIMDEEHYFFARDLRNHAPILIDQAKIKESMLGKGNFGEVFSVTPLYDDRPLALKLAKNHPQARQDAANEVAVTAKIHANGLHRGIMKTPYTAFEVPSSILAAHNYYGYGAYPFTCDLLKLGANYDTVGLEMFYKGFADIFAGIEYLHTPGVEICHGDIKPENIAFDAVERDFRIIDFGGALDFSKITANDLNEILKERFVLTKRNTPVRYIRSMEEAAGKGNIEAFKKEAMALDRFLCGHSILQKVLGHETTICMFSRTSKEYIVKCLWSKEQLMDQFRLRGYPSELADKLYDYMELGTGGTPVSTAEMRALLEKLHQEESQKVFIRTYVYQDIGPYTNQAPAPQPMPGIIGKPA